MEASDFRTIAILGMDSLALRSKLGNRAHLPKNRALRRGRLVKGSSPALPYGGVNFFQTRSFSRLRNRNRSQLLRPIPRARNRRC